MKLLMNVCVTVVALTLFSSQATAADTLKSKLKDAGFGGIIGTWLEEGSGGKNYAAAYTWKIEDRVIEVRTKDPTNEIGCTDGGQRIQRPDLPSRGRQARCVVAGRMEN